MFIAGVEHTVYLIIATVLHVGKMNYIIDEGTIVHPQVLTARDENVPQTLVIHEDFFLRLEKGSVLAPTVSIRRVTQDSVFHSYVNGVHIERHLYRNTEHGASLFVEPAKDGGYLVHGIVNATHRIAPTQSMERHYTGTISHKIYKIVADKGGCDVVINQELQGYRNEEEPFLEARSTKSNYTLELHVLTDDTYTRMFLTDLERISYVTILFHAVSVRLQQLRTPIPICIKSIESSDKRESYVKVLPSDKLLGSATLHSLRDYVSTNQLAKDADFVHLLTGRDMIRLTPHGKNTYMTGTSYVAEVCQDRKVGTSEDAPQKFSGVSTAAHIIGHTLGADHDGHGSSATCAARDGHIMSPYPGAKTTFSKCSLDAISSHIQSKKAECLTKSSYTPTLVFPDASIKLPGNVISGQTYCRSYYPNHQKVTYIKKNEDVKNCKLQCDVEGHKNRRGLETKYITAPDGTKCDINNSAMHPWGNKQKQLSTHNGPGKLG